MSHPAEVLAAEARRAAALVAGDIEALASILDEELVYIHATGLRHDRAQLLHHLRTGPRFLQVALQPDGVRVHSEVALVSGLLDLRLERAGGEIVTARSLVSQAWLLREGAWRLASFQSTRPAG
jgi:ketosteroid isomerase-like protein